jgi:puromycin-sensitive aminopeptidase
MTDDFKRLPACVKPVHYDVFIRANFDTFKFTGTVVVDADALEPTSEIRMNCADIEIESATVNGKSATHEFNVKNEEVALKLDGELAKGKAKIEIKYTGVHNDQMKGFYRTKHTAPDGTSFYSLVTQFESTDARRALPCWDEPACKATFDVRLNVPSSKTALSNMNETAVEQCDDGTTTHTFARSPIMSSYLLAFAVGEYDFVEAKTKNDVLVRVYTDKGCSAQGQFALETGVRSLEYYEDYFNIKYPLPKCDMIAIPDFQAGAMENWGLVTYRSTCILFDEEKSPMRTKQRVAIVVCHELAHQWFGNLVTMEWWTHLWLNEGFASFMEYLCTDALFPEWNIWEQFVSSDMFGAMNLDMLDSSHPIEVEVGHPSEVDEIFDQISYSKGCAVIRMLHNWIGDGAFRTGMEAYLNKFAYSNALTEDLWAELGAASGKPVNDVMSGWTSRMGFPMVTVNVIEWANGTLKVNLKQEKFSKTTGLVSGSEPWKIPLTIVASSGKTESFVFETVEKEVTLSDINDNGWIKLNANFMNWHQVKYDARLLAALTSNLAQLSTLDRLALPYELNTLASAGVASTVDYLKLVSGYSAETEYCIWLDIAYTLGKVYAMSEELDCVDKVKAYIVNVMSPAAMAIGDKKEGESANTSLLRGILLAYLAKGGHQPSIDYALGEMDKYIADKSYKLDTDLVEFVYSTYAKNGKNSFDVLKRLHDEADMSEEKNRLERAISAVTDDADFEKVIDFVLSADVRDQDKAYGLISAAKHGRKRRERILKMTYDRIDYLETVFGGMTIGRYLNAILSQFMTKDKLDEIKTFFEKRPIKQAERSIAQGLETIKTATELINRDGDAIKQFFQ